MSERHATNAVNLILDLGARGYFVRAMRTPDGWYTIHVNADAYGIHGEARGFTLADALAQIAGRLP